jgi:chromosomal replication initiator protein
MYAKNDDRAGDEPMPAEAGRTKPMNAGNDAAPPCGQARQDQLAAIWARLRARLRSELGEDVFNSWFPRMEFVEAVDGVAHLSVPTKFLKSWVNSHYREKLRRLFAEQDCGVEDVEIVVRVTGQRPALARSVLRAVPASDVQERASEKPRPSSHAAAAPAADADGVAGSPLDRRLSFQTFLVGQSNAFAHAAAQQVARAPAGDKPIYNPLYIHSAVR